MTQPHAEPNAAPEGYEGYVPPVAPPHADAGFPAAPQQPYAGQQGYPAAPQPPYAGQQGYPAAPQPPYAGQHLQMQQPPAPHLAYGYQQPKSKLTAGLLGIFLGGFGIHRFYLGHTGVGIIQLVLTVVVALFTLGFGLAFVGLWGFIEGIMILAGSVYFQRDARGIPLRD